MQMCTDEYITRGGSKIPTYSSESITNQWGNFLINGLYIIEVMINKLYKEVKGHITSVKIFSQADTDDHWMHHLTSHSDEILWRNSEMCLADLENGICKQLFMFYLGTWPQRTIITIMLNDFCIHILQVYIFYRPQPHNILKKLLRCHKITFRLH